MSDSASDHYQNVANEYDGCYEGTYAATLQVIFDKLSLGPDDTVVDIGAGTGTLAHQMWKHAGLKHPVLCVEPSAAMLNIARQRKGVVPVLATAEEFFATPNGHYFNKVLMCACVHHFQDLKAVFTGLSHYQVNSCSCVILARPPTSSLPFFKEAKKSFAKSCVNQEHLLSTLHSLGFNTEVTTETMQFRLQKSQWYRMLRERYMSHLEPFTDDEIEKGIRELDEEHFHGVRDTDIITVIDPIHAITVRF